MKKLFSNPFNMTPKAMDKAQEMVSERNKNKYLLHSMEPRVLGIDDDEKVLLPPRIKELDESVCRIFGFDYSEAHPKPKEPPRFIGDSRWKEVITRQEVTMEEYIQDLGEFPLVKDVYLLSDDREEDGTISVLVKFEPLMKIPPHAFDIENERITRYLKASYIKGVKEIIKTKKIIFI